MINTIKLHRYHIDTHGQQALIDALLSAQHVGLQVHDPIYGHLSCTLHEIYEEAEKNNLHSIKQVTLALDDGFPIGILVIEEAFSGTGVHDVNIYVDDDYRREGIASQMLRESGYSLKLLRGHHLNETQRKFFSRLGIIEINKEIS